MAGFSIQDYLRDNKIEMGSIKKEVGDTTFKGGHNDIRKTNYDVNIVDGKLDLHTHREVLTEGVKYPSQEEAESLLAWTNATNGVMFGGAPIVRKAFQKAEDARTAVWDKIFGDSSPWSVERKGNKLVTKWDKYKSDKLGL